MNLRKDDSGISTWMTIAVLIIIGVVVFAFITAGTGDDDNIDVNPTTKKKYIVAKVVLDKGYDPMYGKVPVIQEVADETVEKRLNIGGLSLDRSSTVSGTLSVKMIYDNEEIDQWSTDLEFVREDDGPRPMALDEKQLPKTFESEELGAIPEDATKITLLTELTVGNYEDVDTEVVDL
jgi:hypothetical protein